MNIFYTSKCPQECAEYLDNKRVVKMVLETAQILCTATQKRLGHSVWGLYIATHSNHPCVVWAGQSRENFEWLYQHGLALVAEYKKRYNNKTHKSEEILAEIPAYLDIFPATGFTEPPNCTKNKGKQIDYTNMVDVPAAYKLYLNDRWDTDKIPPMWG